MTPSFSPTKNRFLLLLVLCLAFSHLSSAGAPTRVYPAEGVRLKQGVRFKLGARLKQGARFKQGVILSRGALRPSQSKAGLEAALMAGEVAADPLYEEVQKRKDRVRRLAELARRRGESIGFSPEEMDALDRMERVFAATLSWQRDDGTATPVFVARAKYTFIPNEIPAKGGMWAQLATPLRQIRGPIEESVIQKLKALATLMTWKGALSKLPLGGAKGAYVALERVEKYTPQDLPRLEYSVGELLAGAGEVGPHLDVPAPDMGTDEWTMARMEEAFLRVQLQDPNSPLCREHPDLVGRVAEALTLSPWSAPVLKEVVSYVQETGRPVKELAGYTGKPTQLGGSLGRDEATALGGFFVAEKAVRRIRPEREKWRRPLKGFTVAVQGFGKAAEPAIRFFTEAGARVVAFSDVTGHLFKKRGFTRGDMETLAEFKRARYPLMEYQKMPRLSGISFDPDPDKLFTLDVDILVLAATELAITRKNAHLVKAWLVVPVANGGISVEAAERLARRKRKTWVVPDTLASAGGETVSWFEMRQNVEGVRWPLETVRRKLKERLVDTVDRLWRHGDWLRRLDPQVSLMTAADLLSYRQAAKLFVRDSTFYWDQRVKEILQPPSLSFEDKAAALARAWRREKHSFVEVGAAHERADTAFTNAIEDDRLAVEVFEQSLRLYPDHKGRGQAADLSAHLVAFPQRAHPNPKEYLLEIVLGRWAVKHPELIREGLLNGRPGDWVIPRRWAEQGLQGKEPPDRVLDSEMRKVGYSDFTIRQNQGGDYLVTFVPRRLRVASEARPPTESAGPAESGGPAESARPKETAGPAGSSPSGLEEGGEDPFYEGLSGDPRLVEVSPEVAKFRDDILRASQELPEDLWKPDSQQAIAEKLRHLLVWSHYHSDRQKMKSYQQVLSLLRMLAEEPHSASGKDESERQDALERLREGLVLATEQAALEVGANGHGPYRGILTQRFEPFEEGQDPFIVLTIPASGQPSYVTRSLVLAIGEFLRPLDDSAAILAEERGPGHGLVGLFLAASPKVSLVRAIDSNPEVEQVIQANLLLNLPRPLHEKLQVIAGDTQPRSPPADLLVMNPSQRPQVPEEVSIGSTAQLRQTYYQSGSDGLGMTREVLKLLPDILKPEGTVLGAFTDWHDSDRLADTLSQVAGLHWEPIPETETTHPYRLGDPFGEQDILAFTLSGVPFWFWDRDPQLSEAHRISAEEMGTILKNGGQVWVKAQTFRGIRTLPRFPSGTPPMASPQASGQSGLEELVPGRGRPAFTRPEAHGQAVDFVDSQFRGADDWERWIDQVRYITSAFLNGRMALDYAAQSLKEILDRGRGHGDKVDPTFLHALLATAWVGLETGLPRSAMNHVLDFVMGRLPPETASKQIRSLHYGLGDGTDYRILKRAEHLANYPSQIDATVDLTTGPSVEQRAGLEETPRVVWVGNVEPKLGDPAERIVFAGQTGKRGQRIFATVRLSEPLAFFKGPDGRKLLAKLPGDYLEASDVPEGVRRGIRAQVYAAMSVKAVIDSGQGEDLLEVRMRPVNVYEGGESFRFEGETPYWLVGRYPFKIWFSVDDEKSWESLDIPVERGRIHVLVEDPSQKLAEPQPHHREAGIADRDLERSEADKPQGVLTAWNLPRDKRARFTRNQLSQGAFDLGDAALALVAEQYEAEAGVIPKELFDRLQFKEIPGIPFGPALVILNTRRAQRPQFGEAKNPLSAYEAITVTEVDPVRGKIATRELPLRFVPIQVAGQDLDMRVNVWPTLPGALVFALAQETESDGTPKPPIPWDKWPGMMDVLVDLGDTLAKKGYIHFVNKGDFAAMTVKVNAHSQAIPFSAPIDTTPDEQIDWFVTLPDGLKVGILKDDRLAHFVVQGRDRARLKGWSRWVEEALERQASQFPKEQARGLSVEGLRHSNNWFVPLKSGEGRTFIVPRSQMFPVARQELVLTNGNGERLVIPKGEPVLNVGFGTMEIRRRIVMTDPNLFEDRFFRERIHASYGLIGYPVDHPAIQETVQQLKAAGLEEARAQAGLLLLTPNAAGVASSLNVPVVLMLWLDQEPGFRSLGLEEFPTVSLGPRPHTVFAQQATLERVIPIVAAEFGAATFGRTTTLGRTRFDLSFPGLEEVVFTPENLGQNLMDLAGLEEDGLPKAFEEVAYATQALGGNL